MSSTTTFALTTFDDGSNSQTASKAGVEAVCILKQRKAICIADCLLPEPGHPVYRWYRDWCPGYFCVYWQRLSGWRRPRLPWHHHQPSQGDFSSTRLNDIIRLGRRVRPFSVTQHVGPSTTGYLATTDEHISALCNAYMQLTAKGVSILFASGDGGVASTPGVKCSAKFPPTFPTCP